VVAVDVVWLTEMRVANKGRRKLRDQVAAVHVAKTFQALSVTLQNRGRPHAESRSCIARWELCARKQRSQCRSPAMAGEK